MVKSDSPHHREVGGHRSEHTNMVQSSCLMYLVLDDRQCFHGFFRCCFDFWLHLDDWISGVMDALDGDLARHQGSAGPYGDFLDHTIDRVVDIGIIVAIGFNSDFGVGPSLGFGAALLTLMGSYMGTQAQSVGLGRIYGGFSRADRMVITIIGMCLAASRPRIL